MSREEDTTNIECIGNKTPKEVSMSRYIREVFDVSCVNIDSSICCVAGCKEKASPDQKQWVTVHGHKKFLSFCPKHGTEERENEILWEKGL
jgi:hypothetical protein